MNFKKSVLIMSLILVANMSVAQSSELEESSQKQGSLNVGDAVWVNNLCKRITESGVSNEAITPLSLAIKTCPRRRDYGEVRDAYTRSEKLVRCSEIILRALDVGTVCKTARGGKFMLVLVDGEFAIQDLGAKGKTWFTAIATIVNQYKAAKICDPELGRSLPSREDFELAELRGFREAFSGDMANKDFWSSSVDNINNRIYGSDIYADTFNGGGYINTYNERKKAYLSARCVSDTSVNH